MTESAPDRNKSSSPARGILSTLQDRADLGKLLAVMGLSFLALFVIGILRPLRSAFALTGLAAGDFYQVYFVSAAVVVVAPIYNHLAERVSWQRLIPGTALFFGASMGVFWLAYAPDQPWFGLLFYGWYDLLAASVLTQFFMATQIFYNAREAKRAYPIVIAAGSTGATLGALVHVILPESIAAQHYLLLSGAALVAFALGIAAVWARTGSELERDTGLPADPELERGELSRIASNPQVRLIAATVLLTIVVKQFIDYQYNTLTREVYTDVSGIAGFQGFVDAMTQWMPILVLLALGPVLRRRGAKVAVLIFPVVAMIATGALAVALWLSAAALWVAVGARTLEKTFRYSAERTGREILYVPVPDDIKLQAKSWIDVAVEKGFGKALAGVLIWIPTLFVASVTVTGRLIIVGVASVVFGVLLLGAFLKVRHEYVRSLAKSFEGRLASLRGSFVPMKGTGALRLTSEALRDSQTVKVAFALSLLKDATRYDIRALEPELFALLSHDDPTIRRSTLDVLRKGGGPLDRDEVWARLEDESARVGIAAMRCLALRKDGVDVSVVRAVLASGSSTARAAAYAFLRADAPPKGAQELALERFEALYHDHVSGKGDSDTRLEMALAAGLVQNHTASVRLLRELIDGYEDRVAQAAVESAAGMSHPELVHRAIDALADPRTRAAARTALAARGKGLVPVLLERLTDPSADPWVSRGIASILGEIPSQESVEALITAYLRPETTQALDDQALTSLHRLHASHPNLQFPRDRIMVAIEREVDAAMVCARAAAVLNRLEPGTHRDLLLRALREAWWERRASVFRWFALILPGHPVIRSYHALQSSLERRRAKALEWIESTVGPGAFARIQPSLTWRVEVEESADPLTELRGLWDDEDAWIGRLALVVAFEVDPGGFRRLAEDYAPAHSELDSVVQSLSARSGRGADDPGEGIFEGEAEDMGLIDKVFLLNSVDLLSGVPSRQLMLVAAIAQELDLRENAVLIRRGEPTDALYVVLDGEIQLEGVGDKPIRIGAGQACGTWAMIDEQPSFFDARTVRPTRALRITHEDFHDLLIDHPELSLVLLQGLASRVRNLATQ